MNTKLKLQLVDCPPAAKYFTAPQLAALEESFCVVTPSDTRLVYFGEDPPVDKGLPWQTTLSDGVTPTGTIKFFIGGSWRTQ